MLFSLYTDIRRRYSAGSCRVFVTHHRRCSRVFVLWFRNLFWKKLFFGDRRLNCCFNEKYFYENPFYDSWSRSCHSSAKSCSARSCPTRRTWLDCATPPLTILSRATRIEDQDYAHGPLDQGPMIKINVKYWTPRQSGGHKEYLVVGPRLCRSTFCL